MSSTKLLPQNNVSMLSGDANRWQSLNNDPQFAIDGCWRLAGAMVKISGRVHCESDYLADPVIYVDAGHGISEQGCIRFSISPSGDFAAQVELPQTLKALRFDPVSRLTIFEISEFKIEVLKHSLTFLRRLWLGLGFDIGKPDTAQVDACVETELKDYQRWLDEYDFQPKRAEEVQQLIASWTHHPRISILMPTFNTPKPWLIKAINSVRNQTYQDWELCIADDCSTAPYVREVLSQYANMDSRIKIVLRSENGHICAASNSALELATGDYIGLLDHDDELHPMALFCIANAIENEPKATLIYTDEDKISVDGVRSNPYFKCDFNYDLFLSQNMICHFGVYKTSVVREIGGFRLGFEGSQDYDIALRFLERVNFEGIVHVPFVLYHWRTHEASTSTTLDAKPYAALAAIRALQEHLDRQGVVGTVETAAGATNYSCVNYGVPDPVPSVELIIPTRDAADLVSVCVESILEKTKYENYSITIIDNGSELAETFALFKELSRDVRVQIVRDDSPFNFSAINNRVALNSNADFVGLLNNDMEVISQDWLREMVSLAIQPKVGCVGAKLHYPDNSLQHAGVILGIGGVAGHSHKRLHSTAPGYFSRAVLRSTMSAVTGACLVIRANVYREVGGLDETFSVAFNDVDFCLRVQQAGYRNIWTPYAELIHHESATRGFEDTPEKKARFEDEVRRMQDRWGQSLQADPFYSPNLTLVHEDFSYAWPPRVRMISSRDD